MLFLSSHSVAKSEEMEEGNYCFSCCCNDIFEQLGTLVYQFHFLMAGSVLAVASSFILLPCSCTTMGVSYYFPFSWVWLFIMKVEIMALMAIKSLPCFTSLLLNVTLSFSWPHRHRSLPKAKNCLLLGTLYIDSPLFFLHPCLRGGKLQWKKKKAASKSSKFPLSRMFLTQAIPLPHSYSFHLDD